MSPNLFCILKKLFFLSLYLSLHSEIFLAEVKFSDQVEGIEDTSLDIYIPITRISTKVLLLRRIPES